jgi:hypothetical protein
VGIAKYLQRTHASIDLSDLQQKISLSQPQLLDLGLSALAETGLIPIIDRGQLSIKHGTTAGSTHQMPTVTKFLDCLQELQFRHHFVHKI